MIGFDSLKIIKMLVHPHQIFIDCTFMLGMLINI